MTEGTEGLKPRVFFGRRLTRRQLSDIRRTVELMRGLSRHEPAHAAWRVRRRTVGTLLVMLFVFRLAFSHNREGYPVVIGEAYHGRWGIEELYKVSKQLVRVGQFHARTECGVRQELFARFTVVALTRFLGNRAEDALGGCLRDGGDVQVASSMHWPRSHGGSRP